ncbi:hypothetical protein PI124_g4871 [Phytophthora idaei]|nr:hypothetical protein PI125_g21821 [Phytophthora idaei]KAG3131233.1 hypothetical protein PI126_g20155 [Phytophthora idaei]KAG3250468.1 hypothetical protein PI124_g4871 [Phytophthora idaei]
MLIGERLRPIAVLLNPYETVKLYEINFKRWLANKNVRLSELTHDPEEERRYRQCFARSRAQSYSRQAWLRPDAYSDTSRCNLRAKTEDNRRKRPPPEDHDLDREEEFSLPHDTNYSQHQLKATKCAREHEDHCGTLKNAPGQTQILSKATETTSKTAQISANRNVDVQIKEYTSMSDQIALNELAMNDALAYVKMNEDVDKALHLSQIKELSTVINQEKVRRDATIAAIIADEWEGRQQELE